MPATAEWGLVCDETGEDGRPTDLALAVRAIIAEGCTYVALRCESALRGQWERIAELEAENAQLRTDLALTVRELLRRAN